MSRYLDIRLYAIRVSGKRSFGWNDIRLVFLAFLLAPLCVAQSAPLTFEGATTTLAGDVDRMISYRHQEHSWQTADGHIHVMINTGVPGYTGGGNGLTLYSSSDNGLTWQQGPSLINGGLFSTGVYSTSDGVLVGDDLNLVYSANRVPGGDGGSIWFVVLHYDASNQSWSLGTPELVFDASPNNYAVVGLNPTVTIDQQQRTWCTFVTENIGASATNPPSSIKLAERAPSPASWQDTGLIFGPTTPEQVPTVTVPAAPGVVRSARLVVTSNGIGMIYTVHQSFFWVRRLDTAAVTTQWTAPKAIFTSALPYDKDPYASHFSAVADSQHNLNLAVVDHGRLLYFRYVDGRQAWSQPQVLTGNVKATYPKISLVQGTLEIFVNAVMNSGSTPVGVVEGYQSTDNGSSFPSSGGFPYKYLLLNDQITITAGDSGPLDFTNPRVEMPAVLNNTLTIPVLQQYTDGPSGCPDTSPQCPPIDTVNRAMSFQIQVITP